jgi:hypothetical protein
MNEELNTRFRVGFSTNLILISLVASVGSQILNFITFRYLKIPTSGFAGMNGIGEISFAFVSLCVISPIFETLFMIPILWIVKKISENRLLIIFMSAGIWSVLHATVAIGWAIPIFWSFTIFTFIFLETFSKDGYRQAIIRTTYVHFLTNLLVLSSNFFYYKTFGPKNW